MAGRATLLRACALLALLNGLGGCRQAARVLPPTTPPRPANALVERDVVYGTAGGERLLLDVYRVPTPGPHPAVLIIHGGGWYSGDKAESRALGTRLSRLGFVCFALNYRLTPKFHFPAQVQDCARAARWVRSKAALYGVDPQRLGAWGDSAGAYLAVMLGVMKPGDFQDPGDPQRACSARVQCVVDQWGPTEFRAVAKWPVFALKAAHGFFGGWPDAQAPVRTAASPVARVSGGAAPVLLIHGARDLLVPPQQSQLLKTALDKAGVPSKLIMVPGAGHNLVGTSTARREQLTTEGVVWLQQHLK